MATPTGTATDTVKLVDVDPDTLEQWLAEGDTLLVDVREVFEHATERIQDARNIPLSRLPESLDALREEKKRVVFHCRTGKRSAVAAAQLGSGSQPAHHLAGGIEAWRSSGRPTERASRAPKIDVMRQVQIAAGSLVLLGVLLGVTVSPWFLGLSAFVGAGLVFAGSTGWCGMAVLLSRMPWNRIG